MAVGLGEVVIRLQNGGVFRGFVGSFHVEQNVVHSETVAGRTVSIPTSHDAEISVFGLQQIGPPAEVSAETAVKAVEPTSPNSIGYDDNPKWGSF